MSTPSLTSVSSHRTEGGWMRAPWWDLALISWGWVPFYAWTLCTPLTAASRAAATSDADRSLAIALALALAINFVHRHLVLLVVYGDKAARAKRPRAYALAPVLAAITVLACVMLPVPHLRLSLVGALGTWNIWHVVKQRYGLLRIYARRAGGGLETHHVARRDLHLLWGLVLTTAVTVVVWRRETLEAHGLPAKSAQLLHAVTYRVSAHAWAATAIAAVVCAVVGYRWLAAEFAATPRFRAPRWSFLASTLALLLVFVLHGPVVGYLVFGVAHSVEYLAFVYHFGERRYAGRTDNMAALFLGRLRRAPILLGPLVISYAFLHQHRLSLAFIAYFSTTSALHYLYDGWVWRLREPDVAAPLTTSR